jgi:hypothetical protein
MPLMRVIEALCPPLPLPNAKGSFANGLGMAIGHVSIDSVAARNFALRIVAQGRGARPPLQVHCPQDDEGGQDGLAKSDRPYTC